MFKLRFKSCLKNFPFQFIYLFKNYQFKHLRYAEANCISSFGLDVSRLSMVILLYANLRWSELRWHHNPRGILT